jgi:hypothetical protein
VLAAEHLLGLAGHDLGVEIVEPPGQIGGDVLARLPPLDEDGEIVDAALQRLAERDVGFERFAALQDLLRRRLVFPEVRSGGLLLYFGEGVSRL